MRIRFLLIAVLAVAVIPSSSRATVLLFDGARQGSAVRQGEGDRVHATDDGGYSYGDAGGFTPNIVVDYSENTYYWPGDFGDLFNIIYTADPSGKFQLSLTADPGYQVRLDAFEMAGWPQADYLINAVEVIDGQGATLFKQTKVSIEGDANGPRHSRFQFETPLLASKLFLQFDASNPVAPNNIGLDNIQFGQQQVVPEPPGLLLTCVGLVGLAAYALQQAGGRMILNNVRKGRPAPVAKEA